MSSHDPHGRTAELARELRAGRPHAPAALRMRVREIAGRAPAPAPARRLRRPRLAWLLAPAAAAVVAAVALGVLTTGGSDPVQVAGERSGERAGLEAPVPTAVVAGSGQDAAAGVPAPDRNRAQLYRADLTLRVRDLSDATKDALRLTRSLGGYLRTVEYGSGRRRGTADLSLRVPVGRVQRAVAGYNELGRILDQHVSIRDVQPALDRRFVRMQALRAEVAKLEGDTSVEARARLVRLTAELRALERVQASARRQAAFATVALHLRTAEAEAAPPPPGRIQRSAERALEVLAAELELLVYGVLVGAPFALLGAALWLAARAARRRADARLLG